MLAAEIDKASLSSILVEIPSQAAGLGWNKCQAKIGDGPTTHIFTVRLEDPNTAQYGWPTVDAAM